MIVQSTLPPGVVAPEIPLSRALKVIAVPRAGLAGAELTAIVGVALVTVTVRAGDGARDE